jgi:hypothetical protein
MKNERGAIDILEEAVQLLRSAPASAHVAYLTGAVPFTLALLFFWNDMTHSPFASEHLVTGSLALAVLYIWKNVWQAIFNARLFRVLSPASTQSGSVWRLIFVEAAIQPVSLLIPLPFPWLVAFFRNASLFTALGEPGPMRAARRQAVLWTRQNWAILSILTLASLLVFANALIVLMLVPQLGRSFLGIEGELARSGNHLLNLATFAAAAAIAWLVIDPLLDAVYILRCFYGESMATGQDLRAALHRAIAALILVIALLTAVPHPALAQGPSMDPATLDHSIDQVIHRREFTWRTSKSAGPEPEGRWAGFVRAAVDLIGKAWDYIRRVIGEWLRETPEKESGNKNAPVTRRMMELLIGLVVVIITAAAVVFFLRRRAPAVTAKAVTEAAPAVNLLDDSVTADQLPEASWLRLADEWIAKGDSRLALRALYLAGLNYLGQRNIVSIRKWKSGVDYRRELDRRARAHPEVSPVFSRNVALFERGWYGNHPVDREMVEEFTSGLTRIKAGLEVRQ